MYGGIRSNGHGNADPERLRQAFVNDLFCSHVNIKRVMLRFVRSLVNMYKELESDIEDFHHPGHGDLTGWAKQGDHFLFLFDCI